MSGLNRVMLIGHIGRDAELRYGPTGTGICRFSVATTERWKKDGEQKETTEWHDVTLWGKAAEALSEHLTKGKLVYVEGSIKTSTWTDREGKERKSHGITARSVQLL